MLLIFCLGNPLLRDDGLALAALGLLRERYGIPEGVRLVDGGTLGLALLGELAGADDVIVVDAVRAAHPPGTLVRLQGSDVPEAAYERWSVHQLGVADLLSAAKLLGHHPRRLILLGLVPEALDVALGCSPAVSAGLPMLVDAIARECALLGHPLPEAR